jgi:hypothetical protein
VSVPVSAVGRCCRAAAAILAVGGLLGALAGCVSDTEGGMGLPTLHWLSEQPQGGEPVSGTLAVAENGCFQLATGDAVLFAVWPEGFEHGGAEVKTPSGGRIAAGDAVEGTGVTLDVAGVIELSDGPDGRMGSALGYCSAKTNVVLLLAVTTVE